MTNVTKSFFPRLMILFLLSTLAFTQVGWADIPFQIGSGGTAISKSGGNTGYKAQKAQFLYTAAEMHAVGMADGLIPTIEFYYYYAYAYPTGQLFGLTIKMANTAAAILPAGAFDLTTSLTTVWTGNYIPNTGYQPFTLSTPFTWDGTSNVIIQICCDSTSTGGGGATGVSSYMAGTAYTGAQNYARYSYNGTTGYVAGKGCAATVISGTYAYRPVIVFHEVTGTLSGIVTNAATGAPIIGATVTCASGTTVSIGGGYYSIVGALSGHNWITASKAGFDNKDTTYYIGPSGSGTLNIRMKATCNPPSPPFIAALNAGATAVNLSWGVPKGDYELIYDDGVQEFSIVWGNANNQNAVKFTPLNYPVTVIGGNVNIGPAADYPAGTTPALIAAFKMQVYDANGAGGTPGAAIGDPVTVTPTNFGWNHFTLPGINITSGNFYLVMIQGGTPPAAARLGVDTTANQLRSFSKFVTGGGSWLPAAGNFMIRAVVNGVGGPSLEGLIGYQVYRLIQGQESNEAAWFTLTATTGTSTTDPAWPSLGSNPWRWAVKAHYTGNCWSLPIFSNVLGKNWTARVTVNVTLSCDTLDLAGTTVTLHNLDFDSTYTATLTTGNSTVIFPTVWKGNYSLTVSRFNFITYVLSPTPIFADKVYDVILGQQKTPPTNMHVDPKSVIATWNKPVNDWYGIMETWDSGDFATNGWVADEDTGGLFGEQWYVEPSFGNPAPTALFYYDLGVLNYNLSLTSKSLTPAAGTRLLHFKYDIYFLNDYADALTGMKVEILDGTTWKLLKEYSAGDGSFNWTPEDIDITAYKAKTFKIRFHAYGDDAFNIMYWGVDNISIAGANEDITACILAYDVYLTDLSTSNTILSGQTNETHWQIPATQVKYGTTYRACVDAIYGSGISTQSCDVFTSKFLCAPTNLTGVPIESTAYLTWVAPNCTPGHIVNFILDQGLASYNYGYSCSGSPVIEGLGNYFPIAGGTSGLIKSFDIQTFNTGAEVGAITYQMDVYSLSGNLLGSSATFVPAGVSGNNGWNTVTMPDVPFNGPFYGVLRYTIANSSWAGCAVAYDTLYTIHHNNVGGYFEYNPPSEPFTWALISSQGGAKGAFAIRATAYVYDGKKEMLLVGGEAPVSIGNAPLKHLIPAINTNPDYTALAPNNVPPLQQGYTIWRDGVQIDYLSNNNTLEYYDYNLPSGVYSYEVKAYYDVSPFNPPSLHDNSLPAGPVLVPINFGRPLPFNELWDNGTFAFNQWVAGTNWTVNTATGNPLPCADFSWQPVQTSPYSLPLTSPTLTAAPYNCATLWLDFDYKLISQNNTSNEKLAAQVEMNGSWLTLFTVVNDQNHPWTSKHLKLRGLPGKAFRVRFLAYGNDSRDILHWYVDNIHVYAICTPPTALTATQNHNTVNLSWTAPNCPKDQAFSIILDDGGWEDGWRGVGTAVMWYGNLFQLAAGSAGYLTSFDVSFLSYGYTAKIVTIDVFDMDGNVLGSSAPFLMPTDEFMNVAFPNIPLPESFYAMVKWDITAGSSPYSYFLMEDESGPYAADDLGTVYDGTTFQPISSQGYGPGVFMVRANGVMFGGKSTTAFSLKAGKTPLPIGTPRIASPDARANNSGDTHNHIGVGVILPKNAASPSLQGYNVWRTDSTGLAPFFKRNTAVVLETTYLDVIGIAAYGSYKYYVTDVFNDTITGAFLCESSSDTITLHFPVVGVNELSNDQISIYPNPANDVVNIVSTNDIKTIDVLNYIGQTVYTNKNLSLKKVELNVTSFKSGVYFVKITTTNGIKTTKITVTH